MPFQKKVLSKSLLKILFAATLVVLPYNKAEAALTDFCTYETGPTDSLAQRSSGYVVSEFDWNQFACIMETLMAAVGPVATPNFLQIGDTAGGSLQGTYPNPTLQDNIVTIAKLNTVGTPVLDLCLAVDADTTRVKFVTCGAGSGDVVGPVSTVTNSIPVFADTTGKLLGKTNCTIDGNDSIACPDASATVGNRIAFKQNNGAAVTTCANMSAGQFIALTDVQNSVAVEPEICYDGSRYFAIPSVANAALDTLKLIGTGPGTATWRREGRQVFDVRDSGAVAGGAAATNRVAIQAAIDLAAASKGAVYCTGGTYQVDILDGGIGGDNHKYSLLFQNLSDVVFYGDCVIESTFAGTSSGALAGIGNGHGMIVRLDGTIDNLTIQGITLRGLNASAPAPNPPTHWIRGIWNPSGQSISNVTIDGMKFENTIDGFSFNAHLGGYFRDSVVQNSTFTNIVGEVDTSGVGYGINNSGANNLILSNSFDTVGRHAIYISHAYQANVIGNTITNHRLYAHAAGVPWMRPAIYISRSKNVLVMGNTVEDFYDGAFMVGAATVDGLEVKNVAIIGNTFSQPKNGAPFFQVGETLSGSVGERTSNVIISGNSFYASELAITSGELMPFVGRINNGFNIQIVNNNIHLEDILGGQDVIILGSSNIDAFTTCNTPSDCNSGGWVVEGNALEITNNTGASCTGGTDAGNPCSPLPGSTCIVGGGTCATGTTNYVRTHETATVRGTIAVPLAPFSIKIADNISTSDGSPEFIRFAIVSAPGGPQNFNELMVMENTESTWGKCTFADGDTTPIVQGAKVCKTANTAPTTITNLDEGIPGQTILIAIRDANTTIDFGTNLNGNNGADLVGVVGDWINCTYWRDGPQWTCSTSADAKSGTGTTGDIDQVLGCLTGACVSIAAGATDLLDFSAVDASTLTEGLILPQHPTACAGGTAEGQVCWDATTNTLYIGNGATLTAIGSGSIQNLFETISTTSGTSPVAGSATDTLALIAGTGITVTGDSGANSVTFAATLGASVSSAEIDDGDIGQVDIDDTATIAANPTLPANSVWFGTTGIIGEGATADSIETLVTFEDPTATDKTVTIPNKTGTVLLDTDIGTSVQAWAAVLDATTASFLIADESKLDGIEALADVTDTTNVTAAGALMDSEVDADLKTLILPASVTISTFGATVIDDTTAAAARTTLDVDQAGTDNSALGASVSSAEIDNGAVAQIDIDDTATLVGDPALPANAVWFGTTGLIAEGLTADGIETLITFADPTATDKTITFPAKTGTILLDTDIGVSVQAWAAVLDATTASFLIADESKLDAIEALADVTDTTNVTAAGALMDSEVDVDLKTLSLPASVVISAFGATIVDDANAAAARTTLDVDQAGTDNSALGVSVSASEMADGNHGPFTYTAGVAALNPDIIGTADMADEDHGAFAYSGGVATLNPDVVGTAQMADENHGAFSYTSGVAALNDATLADGDDDTKTQTYASSGVRQGDFRIIDFGSDFAPTTGDACLDGTNDGTVCTTSGDCTGSGVCTAGAAQKIALGATVYKQGDVQLANDQPGVVMRTDTPETVTTGVTHTYNLGAVIAMNGDLNVGAGGDLTLNDAPSVGTDAVNKTYVDGRLIVLSAASAVAANAGTPLYFSPDHDVSSGFPRATETLVGQTLTCQKFICNVSSGDVAADEDLKFTVRKNNTNSTTAICEITSGSTGTDSSPSLSFVEGDYFTIMQECTGADCPYNYGFGISLKVALICTSP